jgi:FkbH-like protein
LQALTSRGKNLKPAISNEIRDELKSARDFAALTASLKDISPADLTARDISVVERALQRTAPPIDLRIAYLGNHTFEPLPQYVGATAAIEGIVAGHHVSPYGQYLQEVLAPDSALKTFEPDIALLSLLMRDFSPEIHGTFATLSAARVAEERTRIIDHVLEWTEAAKDATDAVVLVANFPRPAFCSLGIADTKQSYGETEFYSELNLELLRALKDDDRACVFDIARVRNQVGNDRAYSPKLYYTAKSPWAGPFCAALATEILRFGIASRGWTKKCLVVDMDNTLWGGVLGEDGTTGVQIGPGDPAGEAYADVQLAVKAINDRGVLIAACSRNNDADVDELFDHRPDMPLKREDFAAAQINWDPKHLNVTRIADALNIGTDSLVFIDDSDAECMLVTKALPEVRTLKLPADCASKAEFVLRSPWFERLRITPEDSGKAIQYAANARRLRLKRQFADLPAYLYELGTELRVMQAQRSHLRRAHQLFAKTNQFNVTTKRYTVAELERLLDDPRWRLVVASLKDGFGDMGVVGLYLIELEGRDARIDSFVMSCRALGRDAEGALMNDLKLRFLGPDCADVVRATFIPTAKNAPAADFFANQGLRVTHADNATGIKAYELRREEVELMPCDHIRVVRDG